MTRSTRSVRLAAWAAGSALAVAALLASGHGALSPPPLGSPGRWQAWFDQRDPATAAFALLRLAAVGGCWYLGVVTVLGAVLRLARADVLVAVADRVTVAPVRRLLAGSISVTLAAIGPTGMVAAAAAQPGPPMTSITSPTPSSSVTSSTVGPSSTTTSTSTTLPAAGTTAATITMRRLPPPGDPVAGPTAPPSAELAPADRWTVAPGDCFWTIADDVLQKAWGRAPTDAEIVPYWQVLIEANRAELGDPGNADLIFPGQVFSLPPVPATPTG